MVFSDPPPASWSGGRWRLLWKEKAKELDQFIPLVAQRLSEVGLTRRAAKLADCTVPLVWVDPAQPEEATLVRSSCGDRLCPHCYQRQRLKRLMPTAPRIHALLRKGHVAHHLVVSAPHVVGATPPEQRELVQAFLRRFWRTTAFKSAVALWIKKFEGHRNRQAEGWNEHAHVVVVVNEPSSGTFLEDLDHAAADQGVLVLPKPLPTDEVDRTLAYLAKPSLDRPIDYVTRGLSLKNARDVETGGPCLAPRPSKEPAERVSSSGSSEPRSPRCVVPLADLATRAARGIDWAIEALNAVTNQGGNAGPGDSFADQSALALDALSAEKAPPTRAR